MQRLATFAIASIVVTVIAALIGGTASAQPADVWDRVEDRYADNDGVRLHYVTLGEGPLVVLVHGFPDFWYLWRDYLEALSTDHQVVAMDQRGYNLSDKPKGVEHYSFNFLTDDVAAVIADTGQSSATIIGHDWGGYVAWTFAMRRPEMTDHLVIFNLPHPRGLQRELAHNREQKDNSEYARTFQMEGAHLAMTAEGLADRHAADPVVHQRYTEAFQNSDIEAMLNYYKANYPRPPYVEDDNPLVKVRSPVLQFHGMDDPYLLYGALNGTWEWVAQDLTLVTIPEAGHWAVSEQSDFTIPMLKSWLSLQEQR